MNSGAELAYALLFYCLAAVVVGGAFIVAFAKNIVHSAFALLATFAGVAGLYAYLSADLVAVIQLMVYVGGILILILFAVMLTSRIEEANISNPTVGRFMGLLVLLGLGGALIYGSVTVFGARNELVPTGPMTKNVGNALLSTYVLPFEVISMLLLAALLGAVTIAGDRLRKGPKKVASGVGGGRGVG